MSALATEWYRGQTVPLDYDRRPFGWMCDPAWYILTTAPQREFAAQRWLEGQGADAVWFPTEVCHRQVGNRGRKVPFHRRIAPGYLFMLAARDIAWDVLFDQSLGRLTGVIGTSAGPKAIRPADLAEMRRVPVRLLELHAEAEERRRAALVPPVANARALVLDPSPFAGFVVDVTSVSGPMASVLAMLFGRSTPVQIPVGQLQGLPHAVPHVTVAANSGK